VLGEVEGIRFCHFDEGDVVRHHLVQRIVRAYEDHKGRNEQLSLDLKGSNGFLARTNGGSQYAANREQSASLPEVLPATDASSGNRISE